MKAIGLTIIPIKEDTMITISLDIGGARLKSALVENGLVRESAIVPMDSSNGLLASLPILEAEVLRLSSIQMPAMLGIAFPGLVNPVEKTVASANGKYTDAVGFAFEEWAMQTFGLPLIMENDANAALLGELAYGCAKNCDNAVMAILGTGIGTAAMIEGKLLRGKHFQAGCLGGHFAIRSLSEGRDCTCGSRGCAEAYGSSWALTQLAKESPDFATSGLAKAASINFRSLAKWDAQNDELAIRIMNQCIDAWSACAVNLVHAYDPDLLILSGGVIHCGARITEPIRKAVAKYAWTPWGTVGVLIAKKPEHSVLLGLHKLCVSETEGE